MSWSFEGSNIALTRKFCQHTNIHLAQAFIPRFNNDRTYCNFNFWEIMSEPKSFYFLSKAPHQETKELDGGYNSITNRSNAENLSATALPESEGMSVTSWLRKLLGTKKYQAVREQKTRKVPTKVEPKVFFANERTFLAWLHMSVTLSTISMAIVAFAGANHFSQMYGLLLMPVAIAFCAYSLYMYVKRSGMIRRREPGPCKSSKKHIRTTQMRMFD